MGTGQTKELREYLEALKRQRIAAPDSITEKVVYYKSQRAKAAAIQELTELQLANQLDDTHWLEVTQRGIINTNGVLPSVDYTTTLQARLDRRRFRARAIPWTLIDPLDELIHTVGFKQLGLVIAPYKRGKSMFLLWLAQAYALQGLDVLYITLEDPLNVVEDRLDAIVTHLQTKRLSAYPQTTTKRFQRFCVMSQQHIEIIDGTGSAVTVSKLEQYINQKRSEGFIPNALLVDYDEKLRPEKAHRERRFEFDEIYSDFQILLSKYNLLGWLAAQTQRDTRGLKILSGDRAAEDIGKVRKAFCSLALGKGDWTDNSIYVWVAAHKTDKMEVGCEIIPDYQRACIFDREATLAAFKAQAATNGTAP
jgi:hypothetical protein